MGGERVESKPVTKDELKPVVAETLRVLMRQTGGATALVTVLGRFLPSERALAGLQKDDWKPAIRKIFGEKAHQVTFLRHYLLQLPAGYANGSQYQTKLAEEINPKYIRFYDSLAALLVDCFGEAEIGRVLKTGGASPPISLLYGESVSILANHGLQLANFFTIPNDSREQLQLAKELGPQIYQGWRLK